MKSRTRCMLPVLLLLIVGTPLVGAAREKGQKASKDAAAKPDSQIAKWIPQLGSEEFTVREMATQALAKAGHKAIPKPPRHLPGMDSNRRPSG